LDVGAKFTDEMTSELKNVLVASQQIRHSIQPQMIESDIIEREQFLKEKREAAALA